MSTNLIYNGDFSHGTDSWGGNISVSDGVLTVTRGDIYQDINYLIPVANGRRYKLTFDLIVHSKDTNPWYIALRMYDNNKQHIGIRSVNKVANTNTTLASAIENGATTVQLTSSANWNTVTSHHAIGVCDKKAWGYNRSRLDAGYTTGTISNNTLTLNSAWNLGSFSAGTPVACFLSGSTYYYPLIIANANLPTDWTSYSCEFDGGDAMRYSAKYALFSTLGYSHNYSMRNIKLECISDLQEIDWDSHNSDIKKTGIIDAKHFNEVGAKIRYVRDFISGSTANTNNHWCEFKVINSLGENLAWGKDLVRSDNNILSNTVATDGIVDSSYISMSQSQYVTLDLGYVEDIHKVHIWHYYPDGRTYYNNRVEVSRDGENWWTVYSGQKPETVNGNEIIVTNPNVQIYQNGEIKSHEFYEY